MTTRLPERPSLESLKYQAKQLLKQRRELGETLLLADAQHALAREYEFSSWNELRVHVLERARRAEAGSLSPEQHATFVRRGLVRAPGFLSRDVVSSVRGKLYSALERAELSRDGAWSGGRYDGQDASFPVITKFRKRIKGLVNEDDDFGALCPPELHAAAEQLVDGRALRTTVRRPAILFTPPNAERWEVPSKLWHVDVPRMGEIGCPGVQVFLCIDGVEPGGGATVVVSGSHHFVNDEGRVRSKDMKKKLKRRPWFRGLFGADEDRARFITAPTRDGDVELQVVELIGEPGDVWLMDLRLLHSLAPNTSDRPRLMATQRYFLEELGVAMYVKDGGDG